MASFGVALNLAVEDTVRLLHASVKDVPKGIEVVALEAFRPSEFGSGIGALRGDLRESENLRTYDVAKVLLSPNSRPDWHLVIMLRSDVIGRHSAKGLRVDYEVAGRKGHQVLRNDFELTVLNCSEQPDSASPVCSGAPEPPLKRESDRPR